MPRKASLAKREGDVTLDGHPLTVLGEKLQPGDRAPDFRLLSPDFRQISLAESDGKVRLISVVPAIDTDVCSLQTRRFNAEAGALGDEVVVYTVSVDLPPTLARWRREEGADQIDVLSDHIDLGFADAYGTHVEEIRQEQRAVFVVDQEGIVRHAEYVREIGDEPDYAAAIAAVRLLL
ncbi:MAG: thiol peroxidase [Candidatus Promineifilaceae bacterium]|nr:thiol peroxidase [Candidatus Promineifilaceae bacterium]